MIRCLLMLAFRVALTLCYLPIRLFPCRNKVVFLSRQGNAPSLDFRLLSNQIIKTAPAVEQVMLCRKIPASFAGKIGYGFHIFTQMYHIATARVAVLDGYCIPACLLPHKKSLKIFQIWHALGLMKNFGYAALDSKEGSSSATARIMRMHKGYHKIVCSSPHLVEDIARCYNVLPDQMLPCGLPRMDYLRSAELQQDHREQISKTYPALNDGKPIVLYAPTFRKQGEIPYDTLAKAFDLTSFHLAVKTHDGKELIYTENSVLTGATGLSGLEWLSVASVVVTDYSALMFESLVAQKPTILYCFDREEYGVNRGFAVDYDAIPLPHCTTPRQVAEQVQSPAPLHPDLSSFIDHHLCARDCTKTLTNTILTDAQLLA